MIHVLTLSFDFPMGKRFNSLPDGVLETSAVSFPSRSTQEEFECKTSIVSLLTNRFDYVISGKQ